MPAHTLADEFRSGRVLVHAKVVLEVSAHRRAVVLVDFRARRFGSRGVIGGAEQRPSQTQYAPDLPLGQPRCDPVKRAIRA